MNSTEENSAKTGFLLSFSALEERLKCYDQAADKQMTKLIKAGLEMTIHQKNERQQWTSSLMKSPPAKTNDTNKNFTSTAQEVASLFCRSREKKNLRSIGNVDNAERCIQFIEKGPAQLVTTVTKGFQAAQKRKHDSLEDKNCIDNLSSRILTVHKNMPIQEFSMYSTEGQQNNKVTKPFEVVESVTKKEWTPKHPGGSRDQLIDLNRTKLWNDHNKINANSSSQHKDLHQANTGWLMPPQKPGEKAGLRQESIQKPRINVPTFQQRPSVDSISARVLRGPLSGPQTRPPMEPSVSRHCNEDQEAARKMFKTARDELAMQNIKRFGHPGQVHGQPLAGATKRSLGTRKAAPPGKFVPPYKVTHNEPMEVMEEEVEPQDERLRNIDPLMVEMICNEIMDVGSPVEWDDIAGLEFAKKTIQNSRYAVKRRIPVFDVSFIGSQEIVVWPLLRPDIFCGLRRPPKGILLFGPPGTGKTLIGKCIASQSKSTFFSISASSLTSKWVGDGEKMVRALFAVARCHQPAVVFIDEIDSLLSQRCETEHESSRRIKTEFLVQLDGACTAEEERILVVGATNRPQELDEAARRRLVKRLYVPLPETGARAQMVRHLMANQRCQLSETDIQQVAALAQGFSGADMRDLCREAAYGPIRAIDLTNMEHIHADQVRPVTLEDFQVALQQVRPSVSSKDLSSYENWNKTYGYGS